MNLQKQILILTTVFLTAIAVPAFTSSEDARAEDQLNTIRKCAVLKKQIFRWELATLRDLSFMEENLEQLKSKRIRIQQQIEELEFMLESEERIKNVSSSKLKER